MPADTPRAFFSYCRQDSEFALRLAEDLKAVGANVWMDQLDIEPGTPWDRAVEDALTNCPHMLVILSPVSVKSDNVRDEVSFALSKQKRVIPVLYRDCDVPFRVARLQHIDFRVDYGRGLKTLLKVLGVTQPVATRDAAAPSFDKAARPAVPDSGVRRLASEQVELGPESKLAAEREHQEQERRQAAEQVRLEEERTQAAEQEHQEQERQQAAEQVRLEEERTQAAEQERQEQERQQAAEQVRLEEERKQAAEQTEAKMRLTTSVLEEGRELQAAAEKARLEQEETGTAVASASNVLSQRSWQKIAIALCGIAVLAFLVYRVASGPAAPERQPATLETPPPQQVSLDGGKRSDALAKTPNMSAADREARKELTEEAGAAGQTKKATPPVIKPQTTIGFTVVDGELTWTQSDSDYLGWDSANTYCDHLKLDGLSHWRLPTIDELMNLYDPKSAEYKKIRAPFALNASWLWSSTRQGSGRALAFSFVSGLRDSVLLDSINTVLCVRRSGE